MALVSVLDVDCFRLPSALASQWLLMDDGAYTVRG